MERIRIFAIAAIAVLAIAAAAASSAFATAPTLRLFGFNKENGTEEVLVPGNPFRLTGREYVKAPPFECNDQNWELTGAVTSNNKKTDTVEVKSEELLFGTQPGCYEHGNLAAANMYWSSTGSGSSLGTLSLSLDGKSLETGKAEYKSAPKSETRVKFLDKESEEYCAYGFKKLKGTNGINSERFFSGTVSGKAKLKQSKIATGAMPCPKEVVVSFEFRAYGANAEIPIGSERVA